MGVIAEGILRGCQGLFTPVSLGYPLSVFNKNFTLNKSNINQNSNQCGIEFSVLGVLAGFEPTTLGQTVSRPKK